MIEIDIISILQSIINQPMLFVFFIVIITFILEDLAIAATAIITAQNDMAVYIPLFALFTGIMIGDIGLYGIGKYSSKITFLKRFVDHDKVQKTKDAIDKNLMLAIFIARFIPSMRLPTYTAIGAFNISFKRFCLIIFIAVGLWSSLVFYLFYRFGNIAEEMLGDFKWYGLGGAIILFLVIPKISKLKTL